MRNLIFLFLLFALCSIQSCTSEPHTHDHDHDDMTATANSCDYLDNTGRDDLLSGGVKMIPITTEKGEFKVWTKRVGNNPTMKILLVHGGPGATHEYFESFDSYVPQEGIEYYYYDQLESAYSDQPSDKDLWTIDRYVDEVEQVRKALNLDKSNFYLLGHSWGGILGIEYALKYGDNLKGLMISNKMASIPDYIKYAQEVLGPQLDPAVFAEIKAFEDAEDYANPRYTELITTHYYPKHVLRMPLEEWPDPVNRAFAKINADLYVTMQGPSEFGIAGDAKIKDWDRMADLANINVPTLSIGGAHDTMDPEHMKKMAEILPKGRYLHCPNASHMAMYDDQEHYFPGIIKFVKDVDAGAFE